MPSTGPHCLTSLLLVAILISGACCTPPSATACGLCASSVCRLLSQLCLDNMEPGVIMGSTESARRLNACLGATPALARAFAAWLEPEDKVCVCVGGARGGGGVERLWGRRTAYNKTRGATLSVLVSHAPYTKVQPPALWGHVCAFIRSASPTLFPPTSPALAKKPPPCSFPQQHAPPLCAHAGRAI
jgi:hypothetical protein